MAQPQFVHLFSLAITEEFGARIFLLNILIYSLKRQYLAMGRFGLCI
jgi:hypothetical protein